MKEKICSKCKQTKTLSSFEKRPDSKDGYRQYCRECKNLQSKKAYEKRLIKDSMTFWKTRANNLNKASGRNGVAREIIRNSPKIPYKDLHDLYYKDSSCSYCNIKLNINQIVFDHKIPLSRKGEHNISNIAISCNDCNNLKGVRTDKEFIEFLSEYISRFS